MKSRKIIPFPRQKKNPKAPELKVFEFSAVLKEAMQRGSINGRRHSGLLPLGLVLEEAIQREFRKVDDRKEEDCSDENDT